MVVRHRALAVSAVAAAVLAGSTGSAAAIEPGRYDYLIHHSLHGFIGEHHMQVQEEGSERLVIEHETKIAVGILFTVAYRREGTYREIWEADRLVSFEGETNDDGDLLQVRARAEGNDLLIAGKVGEIVAPGSTVTTQPSHEDAIARGTFMKVATGELVEADVLPLGRSITMVNGEDRGGQRYDFSGGIEQTVWFAEDGAMLKWQLERGGGTVTLSRQ